MLTLRRLWAKTYRFFDTWQLPKTLSNKTKKLIHHLYKSLSFSWTFPGIATRKFLQIITTKGYNRLVMHTFVILSVFFFMTSGLLDSGQVLLAAEESNQYVTPMGAQIASSDFNLYVDEGYLQENNTTETAVSSFVANSIQEYVIQPSDTISSIASMFQTTPRTLQWTNQIQNVYKLPVGSPITVFAGSGIIHTVAQNQNIDQVAGEHGISVDDIIAHNDLVPPVRLVAGQRLVVPIPDDRIPQIKPPEPKRPTVIYDRPPPNAGEVIGSGKFGWPAQGRITKGCRAHGPRDCAIDIANSAKPPLYAADDGVVIVSRWDSTGYGNRIDIDHGNGFITRYAHCELLYVNVGEHVSKGQVIARMGNTGRSSGTHVHFMIIYNGVPQDPLIYL